MERARGLLATGALHQSLPLDGLLHAILRHDLMSAGGAHPDRR
jgi:hypothetical protein